MARGQQLGVVAGSRRLGGHLLVMGPRPSSPLADAAGMAEQVLLCQSF